MRVPVLLIRFMGFDGARLRFVEQSDPLTEQTLPLAANCHDVARQLRRNRLCKAVVANGTIISLEPTRTIGG